MRETIHEGLRRAPVVHLAVAVVLFTVLFQIRNWYLGAAPPDGRWRGYTADDLRRFFDVIRPAGRHVYAWTELTLDLVFPLLYSTLLAAVIIRVPVRAIGRHAIWLPALAALFDYGENALLAYAAWAFDGRDPRGVTIASALTKGKWVFVGLTGVAIVLGIAYRLSHSQRRLFKYIPYIYLLRVPLILGVAMVALPVLARTGLRNVLGNLFVLGPGELFWVSFVAVLVGATILATARVVLLYGDHRFGVAPLGTSAALPVWQPLLVLGIAVWLTAFALVDSIRGLSSMISPARRSGPAVLVLMALAGTLAGVVVVWLVETFRFLCAEPPHEAATGTPVALAAGQAKSGVEFSSPTSSVPDLVVPARFVPGVVHRKPPLRAARRFAAALEARMGGAGRAPGYIDPATGKLLSGHVFALLLLAALLGAYALGFLVDDPGPDRASRVPALVYLMGLLTLLAWAFANAAFLLDRYRVPVVIVPVTLLGLSFLWPTDHFFDTRTQPSPLAGRAQPADLVRHLDGCRLTVVAASGGGIRAAGWTAQVLTGLQRDLPRFAPSLRVLSTVSGGSVGAMYFVGAFAGPAGPPAASLDRIVELAMRSSLNDVAWGMTYPDLWRTFSPIVWNTATDRAWALEQAWRRDWPFREDTLRGWRDAAAAGLRPAVAFNATLVETGQRLALGSFDTPPTMQTPTFERVYGGRDISVITAARLSATFTYVTPVARTRDGEPAWHMADGGYQDNYGVATLVDWLYAALLDPTAAPPADGEGPCGDRLRIAIVRIGAGESEARAANRSWAFQVGAPFQVLLAIRTAGPRARNEMELHLLAQAIRGPRVGVFCFDYANEDSPLSWHLSDAQRGRIKEAWNCKTIQDQRRMLGDFLDGNGTSVLGCS